mmetsp:Transcript_6641/g.16612  ORF Transcript_6641/g.16612 Transcript_6641/m.16612 type:complete len:120 (-) Transcript_6641:653-1012(-)
MQRSSVCFRGLKVFYLLLVVLPFSPTSLALPPTFHPSTPCRHRNGRGSTHTCSYAQIFIHSNLSFLFQLFPSSKCSAINDKSEIAMDREKEHKKINRKICLSMSHHSIFPPQNKTTYPN